MELHRKASAIILFSLGDPYESLSLRCKLEPDMFAICLLYVCYMFAICLLYVCYRFVIYLLYVCYIFAICLLNYQEEHLDGPPPGRQAPDLGANMMADFKRIAQLEVENPFLKFL